LRFFLSLFSVIFTFILLEIFVRFFINDGMNYEIEMMKYAKDLKVISKNKKIGIEHKKNIEGTYMGAKVILDENGFRIKNNKKKSNNKIIMLGDSMTFGWGANETFSDLLNEKLRNHEILNAGIGNTNTIMQISNFFENFSNKYNYDMIVLNFFINDFESVIINKPNFLQKYSYFYTFLNNKLNTVFIKFKIKEDWEKFYSKNYSNKEIREETLNLINKLNKYCLKNNIKFVIHNIPELRDLDDYKFKKETLIIKDFATKNNIIFIDSHDALKMYNEESLWVTKLDPHANDKAHEIISNYLYKNIKKILN